VANGACNASDLVKASESGEGTYGAPLALATDSNAPGNTCVDPVQDVCNAGDITGRYPAIDIGADGTEAIAYLDSHFGFSNTDTFKADLELYDDGALSAIDDSSGAGNLSGIKVRGDGRVVIGHEVIGSHSFNGAPEHSKGIYVAVEQSDGTWLNNALQAQATTDSRISVAESETKILAAFHNSSSEQLLLWSSSDEGATWSAEGIEEVSRTGASPTIGTFSDGTLFAAYGHCRDVNTGDGCDTAQDGIRVTTRRPGDTFFKKQTFTGDPEDRDGANTVARVLPDDTLFVMSLTFPISDAGSPNRHIKIQRFTRVAQ
jgi:hypothetical protein